MTTTGHDLFVTGLKNAHATENQAISILKPQAGRIENYPDIEAELQKHIAEAEGQIARIERILDALGEDKSSLQDLAVSLAGTFAAVGHSWPRMKSSKTQWPISLSKISRLRPTSLYHSAAEGVVRRPPFPCLWLRSSRTACHYRR